MAERSPGAGGDAAEAIRRRAEQWRAHGHDPDLVELVGLLRTAGLHVIAGSEAVLVEHGLKRGQFDVVSALYRAPSELTQADLANAMLITPAGMKKRVDSLVDSGLVRRLPDASDSRKTRLGLTAAGRALVAQLLSAFFAAEEVALSALDTGERDDLRRLLRRVVNSG